MVQENELRIGNIVWDKNNDSFFRVDEIAFFPSGKVYELREYPNISTCRTLNTVHAESYPLTEKILLKAGFKMIDQDGFETSNRHQDLRFSHPIKGKFARDKMFIRFTLSIGNPLLCSLNVFGQETGAFLDIKSLHQLQNLYFALTGTELEVTL